MIKKTQELAQALAYLPQLKDKLIIYQYTIYVVFISTSYVHVVIFIAPQVMVDKNVKNHILIWYNLNVYWNTRVNLPRTMIMFLYLDMSFLRMKIPYSPISSYHRRISWRQKISWVMKVQYRHYYRKLAPSHLVSLSCKATSIMRKSSSIPSPHAPRFTCLEFLTDQLYLYRSGNISLQPNNY